MDASRQDPAQNPSDAAARIDDALVALMRARRPRPPFGPGVHAAGSVGAARFGRGPHAGGPRGPRGFAMGRLLEQLDRADRAGEQLGVGELAAAIGVDQPRASRLVADAVSRGYALRETDARDARRSAIRITDEGRAHLEHARAHRRASVEAALAGFSEHDAAALAELLTRLARAWPRD